MMVKPTKEKLSVYRSRIRDLVNSISRRAFSFCSQELLVRGSPGEVYRRCGQAGCKCMNGDDNRHGPYKVIQVFRDGKQKQVSISKAREHLWHEGKDWQTCVQSLNELKQAARDLEKLVEQILESRLEDVE